MGTAVPALASVDGPCDGTGTWTTDLDVSAKEIDSGEVLEFARADTVTYIGLVARPDTHRSTTNVQRKRHIQACRLEPGRLHHRRTDGCQHPRGVPLGAGKGTIGRRRDELMKRRGRPILGAVTGFLTGLFLGLSLLTFGVIPLDSILLTLLPIIGLVVVFAVAMWPPIRGKQT